MKIRSEIIDGKKRIIIIRKVSGVDVSKKVVETIMGEGWKFEPHNGNKKAV